MDTILQEYDNGTFQRFSFESVGADALVDLLNNLEKNDRSINADIPIQYDANNPSLIKYYSEGLEGVICSAAAADIAKLVNDDESGVVFDSNIRRFLGNSGAVNTDIGRTCSDASSSYQFWFLNNGITVICDKFDTITDPDNPHIKISNLQIINGCQTASALAIAASNGELKGDTRVLLRVYETRDPELIDKIVLTTNNPNRISNRDLKANDPVQLDMEVAFLRYGYLYERKVNQFIDCDLRNHEIVVNEVAGQCYLGIVLCRPSDARGRKYKVWADDYAQIFEGGAIEPHVLSLLVYETAKNWIKHDNIAILGNTLERKLAKNGIFHISRIALHLWRGSDSWRVRNNEADIAALRGDSSLLTPFLSKALAFLVDLIDTNRAFKSDVIAALKSSVLDGEISRALHQETEEGALPTWYQATLPF